MAGVITRLKNMKNIHFIIGGDGPKRDLLEEVREKSNMQDRVTMLGALEHSKVFYIIQYGWIFLISNRILIFLIYTSIYFCLIIVFIGHINYKF